MLTQNSWAKYNNTHDIMCPNGPFAKSAVTSENIDFSQSECDEIRIDRYNVLINGEMAIMKIVTCETE